jgi:hypothetical protein
MNKHYLLDRQTRSSAEQLEGSLEGCNFIACSGRRVAPGRNTRADPGHPRSGTEIFFSRNE